MSLPINELAEIPCEMRTLHLYEVYDDYEVFCPLRDRKGTVWGQCLSKQLPSGGQEVGRVDLV